MPRKKSRGPMFTTPNRTPTGVPIKRKPPVAPQRPTRPPVMPKPSGYIGGGPKTTPKKNPSMVMPKKPTVPRGSRVSAPMGPVRKRPNKRVR